MYKNVFYEYASNLIHHWDDENGYGKIPYQKKGYKKAEDGVLESIFGDPVKEIYLQDYKPNPHKYLESDVKPEHRFIIDEYPEESISKNIKITALDIEVEIIPERPKDALNISQSPNKILAISLINFWDKSKKTFLLDESKRYKNNRNYDFVEVFQSEKELMKEFIRYWFNLSPDIVTGWNIDGYDMPYIYNRLANLFDDRDEKFKNFLSPIGKCRYSINNDRVKIAGISCMDYIKLYKKFTQKTRSSYRLDAIAEVELGKNKIVYEGSLQDLYNTDIDKYVEYNVVDVDLILDLENKLKYIHKARGLAHMAHVPYEDVISAVQTTEGLFLTQTKEMGLVCPCKPSTFKDFKENQNSNSVDGYFIDTEVIEEEENEFLKDKEKSDKIVGAFVKPATNGRFEYTYDEDLISLYPMITVTLNISPETKWGMIENYIDVWKEKDKTRYRINYHIFDPSLKVPDLDKEINITVKSSALKKRFKIKTVGQLYSFCDDYNLTLSANGVFYSKDKIGVIPKIIMHIFNKRVEYKKLRNKALSEGDMEKYEYYDNSQWRMKIVINSIYGVLSNKYFRFYDKDNAQSITLTGQYVNKSGMDTVYQIHKSLFESMNASELDERMISLFEDPIVAGDTDSVIMTAEPMLQYKFGDDWKTMDEEFLLNTTLDISKKISKYINKRMDTFAKFWLNSDNNKLEFKEEWVATTGFYSGVKKRYANRLKLKEGVILEEPETDVKGLDIVRSDFPKICQKFMGDLLDIILDKKDDEIDDFVLNFYDHIEEMAHKDYTNVMKISSVNTMDDWSLENFNFKKGTPIAVKGALNYNKYLHLTKLNRKFKEIVQGDKIRWIYLNKNHFGFKNIAIPQDEYIHPKIDSFIRENADLDKSIEKLLDKKVQAYYDAMDWHLPSPNKSVIDIFG